MSEQLSISEALPPLLKPDCQESVKNLSLKVPLKIHADCNLQLESAEAASQRGNDTKILLRLHIQAPCISHDDLAVRVRHSTGRSMQLVRSFLWKHSLLACATLENRLDRKHKHELYLLSKWLHEVIIFRKLCQVT